MLFNSYEFLFLFLPITLIGFFWLSRSSITYASAWLALASVLFYGFWNPAYVGLLLASIGCNYVLGLWINKAAARHETRKAKHLLWFSIAANLLLLGYYKYANFFLDNLGLLGETPLSASEIILPLGISFFTFTQVAFLVDTYQGKVKEYDFVHYVLFVTFFPHLIAGPVLHHKDMMPQFARPTTYQIKWNNIASGLLLLILGLCKKTLWADSLAPFATGIFDGVEQAAAAGILPTSYEAWAGALAYTLQIYFDFSGYTDMALGIALMFNIRLPTNFNSPYQATSIIEFWRRWHITLSTFLRDYLYIPLGGNRHGLLRRHTNLLTTMLLGGLWHGAGWNFFCWGGLLWICIVLERQLGRLKFVHKMKVLPHIYLWLIIPVSWMCFAITDLSQLQVYLDKMMWLAPGISGGYEDAWKALSTYGGLLAVSGLACTPAIEKLYDYGKDKILMKILLAAVFWYCVWRLILEGNNPFMYFSF